MSLGKLGKPSALTDHYIRLLELNSSTCSEEISFRRHTVDLRQSPHFKALSYAWGSADGLQTILVEERLVEIGRNLFDFLQFFRRRDDRSLLWIDQLCIDQENVAEKGHQVGMMDQIYALADETFVWLGADPDEGLAVKVVDRLGEPRQLVGDVFEVCAELTLAEVDAFSAFMQAAYWGRHWVAQEVLLSEKAILLYGTNELSWKKLAHMSRFCHLKHPRNPFSEGKWNLLMLKNQFDHRTPASVFVNAIEFAARSDCVDPRDKVFGIQGILTTEYRVPVDYTQSVLDLYLNAVEKWYNVERRRNRGPCQSSLIVSSLP